MEHTHHHHHHHHEAAKAEDAPYRFEANPEQYRSLSEVQDALHKAGLESSNLIIGVDFTESNLTSGKKTFGPSLHTLSDGLNPYQQVMDILGRTLEPFDDDHLIPAFGFGDEKTKEKAVFPFYADGHPCLKITGVLQRYTEIVPKVTLWGPTSFAPIIDKAVEIVKETGQYHILVIIADGQVNRPVETTAAIVRATNYPLSIVVVGVGDGPWDEMKKYDDELPDRKFDNFHFVDGTEILSSVKDPDKRDATFSVKALQEIPPQYLAIKKLGLLP